MNNILITPEIKILLGVWIFAVGLCIGSFLNVVVLRGLSGESIIFPASKCPKCGNKLKWWMNIPVLSYLIIRGKCHYCREHVSIQYPIVEFLTGLFFLLIFLKFNITLQTLFYITGFSLFMDMAVTDIKESVIFDFHGYLLILSGIIFNIFSGGYTGFLYSMAGAVSGFLLFEIIARSGYLLADQRAFGEGDSLIAAGIGAFFGWKLMVISSLLSVIIMALCVFPFFLIRSYKTGKKNTAFALIASIILMAATFLISHLNLIKTFSQSVIFLIVIITGTILCAYFILNDMKKKDDNGNTTMCMLPFGPSMMISYIIIMFYGKEIETFIKSYFLTLS